MSITFDFFVQVFDAGFEFLEFQVASFVQIVRFRKWHASFTRPGFFVEFLNRQITDPY